MATMKDFDPVSISNRLVERTKSDNLKQMVMQNESNRDSESYDGKEFMELSVKHMFETIDMETVNNS